MLLRVNDLYRTDVVSARGRRIGRVGDVLFDAAEPRVVGYVVERPRFLFMLDRKDRLLAFDRTSPSRDEVRVVREEGAWDKKAADRLGIDWETTVIWAGMTVRSARGAVGGRVKDATFDTKSGQVESIVISGGTAADVAVGTRRVPRELLTGFRDGAVVVADAALAVETSGGAAAAAGKGAAVAKKHAIDAGSAAGKSVRAAAKFGKAAARSAARSDTGKKTIGWLKSMRDEIVDAMGDVDDDD